jgi:hypothetical protein
MMMIHLRMKIKYKGIQNTMKKILSTGAIMSFLLLMGCGFTPIYKAGELAYDYVGCHTITQNPGPGGERAFVAVFDLNKGDTLLFKQVSPDGKTVNPITTGVPCK